MTPAIEAELDDLRNAVTASDFSAMTGLPFRQQWSLTKHRWLLDNVPSARDAVRRLNVAEWIVRGLGGEEATRTVAGITDRVAAAGERSWWGDTLEWSGASESLMPALVTAGTPLGRVSADAGLPRLTGAVLTVAGHDHQAAVIGAGADGPGDELDSCGTAEALVRTVAPGSVPASGRRTRRVRHHHRMACGRRQLVPARCHSGWIGVAAHPRAVGQGPEPTCPPWTLRLSRCRCPRCESWHRHSALWTFSASPMATDRPISGERRSKR